MRKVCLRTLTLALAVMSLMCGTTKSSAQTITTLMEFTNGWRYDQTGRDLGTAWRAFTFTEDGNWQGPGAGLLGLDNNNPPVYPLHQTTLSISDSLITYYLRGGFNFSGPITHMTLIASNYVDDGAVAYLNGTEIGRVRVAAGQTFATRATGGTEGVIETLVITNLAALRQGTNVLAVELHQGAVPATDITWGTKLVLFRNSSITFTQQPQSQTITAGDDLILNAGVSGGPAFYQWQLNNVNIPGATNGSTIVGDPTSRYAISNITLLNAGQFRVIVTNTFGRFTSDVATVTVTEDVLGPKLVTAIMSNPILRGNVPNPTNTINLSFDEAVSSSQGNRSWVTNVYNTNNYRLISSSNPNIRVGISNILYNPTVGAVLWPFEDANWSVTNSYYLVVNNVSDTKGNRINPNSVIGVSTLLTTNLTQTSDFWLFYDRFFLDPGQYNIYNNAGAYANNRWYSTNFVDPYPDSGLWTFGTGIFVTPGANQSALCAGDSLGDPTMSYQDQPTLFRKTFTMASNAVPASFNGSATLKVRYIVDDGMILYLNGLEIFRTNIPAGTLSDSTRAPSIVGVASNCFLADIQVTNLRRGSNWLAVGVYQSVDSIFDTLFGMEIDAVTLRTASAPTNPITGPRFTSARLGNTNVITWPTNYYGFAFQYSTNIPPNMAARAWFTNDLYWTQVKDQSNPYTNALPPAGARRFYRLVPPK